jgi:predicted nucleic acid-binding protein
VYAPPTSRSRALDQIAAWLESPRLVVISEDDGYFPALRRVVEESKIEGPRIHDARIAAICLQNGVTELWSADRDFSRFADLVVRNPLTGA